MKNTNQMGKMYATPFQLEISHVSLCILCMHFYGYILYYRGRAVGKLIVSLLPEVVRERTLNDFGMLNVIVTLRLDLPLPLLNVTYGRKLMSCLYTSTKHAFLP